MRGRDSYPRLLGALRRRVAGAVVLVVVVSGPSVVAGGDAPHLDPVAVRKLVEDARKDGRAKDPAARIRSADALGATDEPLVADELVARLRKERDLGVEEAVIRALGRQRASRVAVEKVIVLRLAAAADEDRKRALASDPGFLVNPKTGNPDLTSPEGRLALETQAARSRVRCAAIGALKALGAEFARPCLDWIPFLQDPNDDLVVATLEAISARGTEGRPALPTLLDLFRMYPVEKGWETGGVVDLSGTNASAKAKWTAIFGHPDKQKARPRVFRALSAAIVAVTGRNFDVPEALEAHMKAAEGPPPKKRTK